MTSRYWPLFGLRLPTPRLELRLPTPADLDELAALAAAGIHDPAVQPFAVPWTDVPPEQRAAASLAVSRKLGYGPDGIERHVVRGRPAVLVRLRLHRAAWEAARTVPVEIGGLGPCLPHFGVPPPRAAQG